MRKPGSYTALEDLGRVRLSRHFFMRNFLHSEISNFFGKPNIPDQPDLAIEAGRGLARNLLDPLVETFGPVEIRSGFRSQALNHFGATEVKPQKCSANERNSGVHIWDIRDDRGALGACVSLVVPWFADQYENGRDWRDLAWWIHDHLPYSQLCFFPILAAFNLTWSELPKRSIASHAQPSGTLLKVGAEPGENLEERQARYADFPPLRGIAYPALPENWGGV